MTTHVFIVDSTTFKLHLEYLFAGTGAAIGDKLQRLHRLYLDEDIERDVYRREKADLLSRKKSLEEKMADLNKGTVAWLGLMREWVKDAENIRETVVSPSLPPKKSSAQKIFGSNLFLNNRLLVSTPTKPYASLREARLNFSENELCLKLERAKGIGPATQSCPSSAVAVRFCLEYLYNALRTYFTQNP